MKSFKQHLSENKQTHYKHKNGHVVLLHSIGDYEGLTRHGKKRKKLKEELTHYKDADQNVNDREGTGLDENEFGDASLISERLTKAQGEISERNQKWLRSYSKGSRVLNKSLIKAHKDGHENFDEHEGINKGVLQKTHNAVMESLHPPGRSLSLFSGTSHDFSQIAKDAKDGIIQSPAHISASHDIDVGMNFARQHKESGWKKGGDDPAHMVHIQVKPHNKIVHMSPHSDYPQEHESIVAAGTKLRYTHSTEHWTRKDPLNDPTGPRAKVNIHHFEIHDPWIKN